MTNDESVDDDLDRVPLVLVELGRVRKVVHLPVDADADEALPPRGLEDAVAFGLAVLDQRAEDEQSGPFRQRQDLIDDLLDGLALDLSPAGGAMGVSDAGEQQAEVIVDLGPGPDRRARVPA